MQKLILTIIIGFSSLFVKAQWTTNGSGDAINNNSSGKVGIGTTSPAAKLDVSTNTTVGLNVSGNNSSFTGADINIARYSSSVGVGNAPTLQFSETGSLSYNIIQSSAGGLQFFNSYNSSAWIERFRITPSGSVGIGTTNPSYTLDVAGIIANGGADFRLGTRDGRNVGSVSFNRALVHTDWGIGNDNLVINFSGDFEGGVNIQGPKVILDGNVGIGTTSPVTNARLDVQGGGLNIGGSGNLDATLHIKSSYGNFDRLTQMNPSVAGKHATNLMASTDASMNYYWWSWGVLNSGVWAFQPSTQFGGATGLFIDRNGNTGIGNNSPDAKLAVSGQVHAQEVKVSVTVPGPDYVFEKDYKLTSLEGIKNYIDQNKHLPEVPSAQEMEKNGVQLGEMNMLLLKKIEELTLYVIEQNKRMEVQQARIDNQEKEIQDLKRK